MSDDPTKDLTTDEMLKALLADMRDVKERLGALESQSKGTTRPLLDQILQEVVQTRDMLTERTDRIDSRLEKVEKEVRLFGRKMDIFNEELLDLRQRHRDVEDRVSGLERKPN